MRSVMITGASRGIGLEFARQYLADGYKVYATCQDRKSTRLNPSHLGISYAVFCLKKKREHAGGRRGTLGGPRLRPAPSTLGNPERDRHGGGRRRRCDLDRQRTRLNSSQLGNWNA